MTPQDAMQFFGSQNKMAWAFGVTPPAVLRWRRAGKFPPRREYELVVAIERHRTRLEAAQKPVEPTCG
jgi:DNA-binding transcriptional regulator YdaS (Cro superfamily)